VLHERNAIRLRDMCSQNKGIYIKLGQHLAMLDYMFPSEYQEILSSLLANTPTSSIESVRRVIHSQFGIYLFIYLYIHLSIHVSIYSSI
jgi:aarF domain-containing kinase